MTSLSTRARKERAAAHATLRLRDERLAAQRAAVEAVDHFVDGSTVVDGYTRTRLGNTERVQRFYKGYGPRKSVPNVPLPRLRRYLLAHGVAPERFTDAYRFVVKSDGPVTTHCLQAAGLLDTADYFDALNALPKGARF